MLKEFGPDSSMVLYSSIPPSADGVGIFGTLMDAWQRPIDDVDAKGRDGGNGGKYVLVPEGYQGPLLAKFYT